MPSLLTHLAALGRPKAFLATALMLWLGGGYFLLQRLPSPFEAMEPPRLGGLEELVPFAPWTVWIYFSYYLLIPLPAFLARGPRELGRAIVGPALVALGAFAVFWLAPTILPRPRMPEGAWGYQLLVSLDRPTNVFPSLHAALSVHVGLLVERVVALFGARRSRITGRVVVWLWVGTILVSTLALRQHVIADLVAGALLGVLVYVSLGRRRAAAEPAAWRLRPERRTGTLVPAPVPIDPRPPVRPARLEASDPANPRPV